MTAPSHQQLRLVKVLEKRKEAEGSFVQLARKISEANGVDYGVLDPKGRRQKDLVDRRKLKSIVAGNPNVVLSLAELIALDNYLDRYNEGLAHKPILERPAILQSLAEDDAITFVLGSKRSESDGELNFSYWDVIAMAEIQRSLGRFSANIHFDIRDVVLRDRAVLAPTALEEGWIKLLADDGPSLVCLGSPKSCHAAEAMLARMFHTEPFVPTPVADDRVPFHLFWPDADRGGIPSAFVLDVAALEGVSSAAAAAVRSDRASGVQWGKDVAVSIPKGGTPMHSQGAIVVQRRRAGQVWMVLAGLSGPATHAAALLAPSIPATLPATGVGREGPVLWVLIDALVEGDSRSAPREGRRLLRQHFLTAPQRHQEVAVAPPPRPP